MPPPYKRYGLDMWMGLLLGVMSVAFVLVLVIAVISALIYVKAVRPVSYHHEVIEETEVESEQGN